MATQICTVEDFAEAVRQRLYSMLKTTGKVPFTNKAHPLVKECVRKFGEELLKKQGNNV